MRLHAHWVVESPMPRVTAQSPRTGHYAANPTALPYSFPPTPLRTSRLSVETGAPMQTVPTRRLAAILLADIAGYSRLMERDEQGTHQRLRELRAEVTDPAIARHHGRFVRAKGDDLLVEFSSAVEALSCAVEIQRAMAERNRDLAPEARLQWRIGINLGDILVDGNDIAGDGVNVAARLEALAEPGGVAVSAAVREQVRQLSGVQMAYAGEHRVKNISRPIRVYKVRHDGGRPPPAWRSRLRKGV
ncbi:MAG: adenylate/guanylate cyclase domain-containing protein, partial [Betaproteobacteria bacterium]